MTAIARFVVRQRAAVILLALILLVAGIVTAARMQTELFPNVSLNTVTIITPYPGASPNAVLRDVTKPIETAAGSVPGIETLISSSNQDTSVVTARFAYGTDLTAAETKISTAVAGLQFPPGVQKPQVSTIDFSAFPIIYYAIRASNPRLSLQGTYALVQSSITPQLTSIPGVAAADVSGGVSRQVTVTLDPAKLAATGLTPDTVNAVLQANNVQIPTGAVTAGGRTQSVVTTASVGSLRALRALPLGVAGATPRSAPGAVGPPASGTGAARPRLIRLGDVATVTYGQSATNTIGNTPGQIAGIVRFDGRPAISLSIRKNANANIVTVANAVNAKMRDLGRQYPQLTIGTIYDSSTYIKSSVGSLLGDGVFGAVFAIIVIFLFLLTVRTTLVTAISIPLSILVAIVLLYLFGYTLNIMTISAIAVAVGRVVDDAIVVLENIFRHVQEGDSRVEATVSGVREVSRAIIGSTLTTISVFLPIGFIGGILGQFFQPFALTVTFALVASLLVALVVVPALASLFITRRERAHTETALQRAYTPILGWALAHRAITVVAAGVLFVASLSLSFVIPKGFFPASNETLAQLSVNLPAGASVAATTGSVARVEQQVLRRQPGIAHWETIVGYDTNAAQRGGAASASNAATLLVVYRTGTDMTSALDRLRRELKPYQRSGTVWTVASQSFGPPSNVDILVRGGGTAQLRAATNQVLRTVASVPGLVNVQSNLQARRPQITIAVRPAAALAHGLTPATAALAIRGQLTGQTVTTVNLPAGPSPVFVQVDPRRTARLSQIERLMVGTPPVAVGRIATVTQGFGPVAVPRQNQQDIGEVTAGVTNVSDASRVTAKVQTALNPVVARWAKQGVTIEQAGISKDLTDGFINMGIAMLVAIGLVYLVMVFVFRSLLVPFVILFSLPLAVIGALVALAITRRTLDMSALIGVLMLIGVVVTNAVVLLDLVQQRLADGLELHAALISGGRTRVRPILMTALATILALMPLAVLGSGGGLIAANLATVVIGGLLTSTLLTLVVVPVVYSLFSSMRGRMFGRRPGTAGTDQQAKRHRESTTEVAVSAE